MLARAAMIALPAVSTIASRDVLGAGGNNTWTDSNNSTAWFSNSNWYGTTNAGPPGQNGNGSNTSIAFIPVGYNYTANGGGSLTIQFNSGSKSNFFGSSGYSLGELSFTDSSVSANDPPTTTGTNDAGIIVSGGSSTNSSATNDTLHLWGSTGSNNGTIISDTAPYSTDGLVSIIPGGGSVTPALTIMLGNSQSTINVAGTNSSNYAQLSITAPIVNGGSASTLNLNLNTTGLITLGGTSTYSGGTNVSGGTLIVSGGSSGTFSPTGTGGVSLFGSTLASKSTGSATSYVAGALTATSGTNVIAPGGVGAVGTLDLGSTLSLNSGDTLNFDISSASSYDLLAVTGAVSESSDAAITLGSGNTYTAGTTYTLATYATSNLSNNSFGTLPTLPTGFHWNITNTSIQIDPNAVSTDTWTPQNGTATGTWDINSTPNWTVNGTAGSYYNDGDNVIFNDISGSSSGTVTIASGGVNPTSVLVNNTNTKYTFTGASINGSGTLTKTGSGTLILNNSNNYSSGTTISGGTLQTTVANALPSTGVVTLVKAAGVLLDLDGNNQTIGNIAGGGASGGNVALGGAALTVGDSSNQSFSGVIADTGGAGLGTGGSLIKTGSGTLTLGGVDTYSGGTTISSGTLSVSADSALGTAPSSPASNITIAGGQLQFTSSDTLNSNRTILLGVAANSPSFSTSGSSTIITYGGAFGDYTTAGTLVKQGGGTLVLTGVSSYTGGTSINNGTIQLGTANALPTGTVLNLGQASSSNQGTFDLNGSNQQIAGLSSTAGTNSGNSTNVVTSSTTAATLTINLTGGNSYTYSAGTAANSGVISGPISLAVSGSGTETLNGTNPFTGTTGVSGGTLYVNGKNTGTGAVTVYNGGKLSGSGTIAGPIEVQSGAIMAAGGSATGTGSLATSGGETWDSGGTYTPNVTSTTGSNPAASELKITGGLNLSSLTSGSTFTIEPNSNGTAMTVSSGEDWVLATIDTTVDYDGTSGVTNTNPDQFVLNTSNITTPSNGSDSGFGLEMVTTGATSFDLELVYSGTPEPGTALLVLSGVAPMLVRRRRRKFSAAEI